jgi:serine/threonine-protein kinase
MSHVKTLEVPGYQVLQYLGSGARSTVWQIRDLQTDETYALKRVIKRDPSDARFLEQAINEYEVGVHFDHPAVRHIYRLRRLKRWLSVREVLLVMEHCEGQTVQQSRPQSVQEAVCIFDKVAKGLSHINARGYVHADTKPNNIIVSPKGDVKIIDLGQSCPLGTVKERIQGTPDFIAPEQVNRRPLDARTDVFNFGAALYWTLTGRPIPTVMPKKRGITLKAELAVIPADQVNEEVPSSLSKLISDCIELNPARRLPSMNEVVSRLGLIAHTLKRNSSANQT